MKSLLILIFCSFFIANHSVAQNRTLQRHLLFDVGKSNVRAYEAFILNEVVDSIRLETLTDYHMKS